jgi:hypothetical protein
VTPDVENMMRRVVLDVFDDDVEVAWDTEPGAAHVNRVALSAARAADRRTVGLRAAATGVFDLTILDLGVSATLFEYDDEDYMEAILRELALVADAYLSGEGRIEQKRGMLRTRPVMTITVNGNEWTLGQRTSKIHYPEDTWPGAGHD